MAHGGFETSGATPEPLEPPARPVWEAGTPSAPGARSADAPPPPPSGKVSLASAFSALLAAEQMTPPPQPAAPPAAVSDAALEEAIRRVLVRMTDEVVRGIVHDTAERLVKEEIDRIKANSQ